ncbi:hypothetical protein ACJJTC_004502 [Scirpophaga incertulas]
MLNRPVQWYPLDVAAWLSVAEGNWRAVQRSVAKFVRTARASRGALAVIAGTHGESGLRLSERVSIPKYLWTVVVSGRRAVALIVLNDPFVSLHDASVTHCRSVCERLSWLREAADTPVYGLLSCCYAADLNITELPSTFIEGVSPGDSGLLADLL